jgi:hypothetical protein
LTRRRSAARAASPGAANENVPGEVMTSLLAGGAIIAPGGRQRHLQVRNA